MSLTLERAGCSEIDFTEELVEELQSDMSWKEFEIGQSCHLIEVYEVKDSMLHHGYATALNMHRVYLVNYEIDNVSFTRIMRKVTA